MAYVREFIIFITSSFTFLYIISIFSFNSSYRNILYYPTPNSENLLGSFGSYIASISFFIFGKAAYFLVFPLFFIIIALIFEKKRLLIYSRNTFFLLLIVSGFVGLFSKEFYGGLIGGLTGILFRTLFGFIGTLFILLLATIYVLSLFFENKISLKKTFNFLKNNVFIKRNDYSNVNERKDNVIEISEYKVYDDYNNTDNRSFDHNDYEGQDSERLNTDHTNNNTNTNIINLENTVEYADIDYEIEDNFYKDIVDNKDSEINATDCRTDDYIDEEKFKIVGSIEIEANEEDNVLGNESDIEYKSSDYSEGAYTNFKFPSLDLLKDQVRPVENDEEEKIKIGSRLIEVLKEFNIEASLANIVSGPVITRYEIVPPKGLKLSKIVSLEDNISLGLASHEKIRIEAPVPGKNVVGVEIPNNNRAVISLKEMFSSPDFKHDSMAIPFALGKDITGKPYYADIAKIPHLLIAGSTGSGKSVCLNSLITTILYTKRPDELKLILVDPKRVELKLYDGIPHLITPVIKEIGDAINMLNWAVSYMEERYRIIENSNVRNIKSYNLISKKDKMPYLLIIIDEFADFIITGKKEIEEPIIRLAAMARAVGIHLVLATQRPSADIITNLIKANFPGRISFKVATKLESRIILDVNGAEKLLGKGDMLYASPNSLSIKRLQSPFISDEEVYNVTEFYRKNFNTSYWDILEEDDKEFSSPTDEPLFNEAVNIILRDKKASASYLQRRLKIGYNRAARIIEMMEEMGIVSPAYSGKREILIDFWAGV